MMILKLNDNGAIENFFIGNDTPPFEGLEYDEEAIDKNDFIANWFLYSYTDGKLYKDEEKTAAYQAQLEAEQSAVQELIDNPPPTAQEQINAMLMKEIAQLKAQVTAQ